MSIKKLDEIKVFRDPIYTYIKVEYKVIWDIINSSEFQRLRRVRQLGGVGVVFHNAEHSRFSHSLGVYNLARQVIKEVRGLKDHLSEKEQVATMAAALLHDIGHGAFSHSFEQVFKIHHEEYSIKIILGDTEVNKVLQEVSSDFPEMVASIIRKDGKHPLLSSIISNQIDVDRADYLQRDAYFTGANYGTIDIPRLIRTMKLVNNELVFKESSVHTLEDYLMSRYQMYWQVYFHRNSRSFEVLLEKVFLRIKDLMEQGYEFDTDVRRLKAVIEAKEISVRDYLRLDDIVVTAAIINMQDEKDEILADLAYRFVNRKIFKDREWHENDENTYEMLEEHFKSLGVDPKYYLAKDAITQYIYKNMNTDVDKIKIITENNEIKTIEQVSQVLSGLTKIKDKVDYRIYYPKDLYEKNAGKSHNSLKKIL